VYNVFKRPMFKRGGTAQGSGIMSTVEPRQQYKEAGPVYPFEKRDPQELLNILPIGRVGAGLKGGLNILRQAGRYATKPDFYTGPSGQAGRTLEKAPFLSNQYFKEAVRPYVSGGIETLKRAGTGIKDFAKKYGIATGIGAGGIGAGYAILGDDEIPPTEEMPFLGADDTSEAATVLPGETAMDAVFKRAEEEAKKRKPKETKTDSGVKDGKKSSMTKEEEIRDEAKFIKNLLKDENVTRGETALILAEALATPGGINKKLEKARALSLPLIRERAKQDKAVTLAAYQAYKEKEQQQIKSGALPNSLREIRAQAEAIKAGGDPRSVEDIYNAEIIASRNVPYESKAKTELLARDRQYIIDTANSLAKAKDDLSKLDPTKDKKKYDSTKALYDKALSNFNRDYLSVPEFKMLYQGIYDQFAPKGKQNGGRIMKAVGGDVEEETTDIVASQMNFGGEETPIKPVEKLDYATLRDRLPREINDQVVQLLSSSEEALQDFAYITNQSDVDKFNVKYGVNLMIPPAQQTA
jgi:hypothetical protein